MRRDIDFLATTRRLQNHGYLAHMLICSVNLFNRRKSQTVRPSFNGRLSTKTEKASGWRKKIEARLCIAHPLCSCVIRKIGSSGSRHVMSPKLTGIFYAHEKGLEISQSYHTNRPPFFYPFDSDGRSCVASTSLQQSRDDINGLPSQPKGQRMN